MKSSRKNNKGFGGKRRKRKGQTVSATGIGFSGRRRMGVEGSEWEKEVR